MKNKIIKIVKKVLVAALFSIWVIGMIPSGFLGYLIPFVFNINDTVPFILLQHFLNSSPLSDTFRNRVFRKNPVSLSPEIRREQRGTNLKSAVLLSLISWTIGLPVACFHLNRWKKRKRYKMLWTECSRLSKL
ncbi:MAG: hypothetical protein GY749_14620 [Desulfobacteraceae bacterium]|nr:hypothetical protein [Desulfobacteraceae bacterium]